MSLVAYSCAACGEKTANFSKRQRKRAEMGSSDARCMTCVSDNVPLPNATAQAVQRQTPSQPDVAGLLLQSHTATTSKTISVPTKNSNEHNNPERLNDEQQGTISKPALEGKDDDESTASTSSSSSDSSSTTSSGSDTSNNSKNSNLEKTDSTKESEMPNAGKPSSSRAHTNASLANGAGEAVAKTTKNGKNSSTLKNQNRRSNLTKRQGRGSLYDDEDEDDSTFGVGHNNNGPAGNISLAALKDEILGRKVVSMYDDNEVDDDDMHSHHDGGHLATPGRLGTEISDSLRQELACAICHDSLYQPISLLCGHSFCKACIEWWLTQQPSARGGATTPKTGSCPTCRQSVSFTVLNVNTALRACLGALLGHELDARRRAKREVERKARAGENGGAHSRGYEIVQAVTSAAWKTVRGKTKRHGIVTARRSIVLDDQDQRMQLALAIRSTPKVPPVTWDDDNSIFEVSLCLLTMEEDEVADGGFPLILDDPDDEPLIATENRFLGAIDVTAIDVHDTKRASANSAGRSRPITRRVMGNDGAACFSIKGIVPNGSFSATEYCFRHQESGAELHLRIPVRKEVGTLDDHDTDDVDHDMMENTDHLVEEQYNDDAEEEDFEDEDDDGFIVPSDEDNDHNDEDEGECCICLEGGELMVCDGGDNLAGCGCYFHTACIRRSVVPPGDWVCQGCANSFGLVVGIEGHEFRADNYSAVPSPGPKTKQGKSKREKRPPKRTQEVLELSDSDSEEFGSASFSPDADADLDDVESSQKNKKVPDSIVRQDKVIHVDTSPEIVAPTRRKRQRVLESDDEEEF